MCLSIFSFLYILTLSYVMSERSSQFKPKSSRVNPHPTQSYRTRHFDEELEGGGVGVEHRKRKATVTPSQQSQGFSRSPGN